MIIALTDSYQLMLTSRLHWSLVLFAFIGLVLTCTLIYRRFSAESLGNERQVTDWSLSEKGHFSLLILANTLAFISVLLFILPVQVKVDTPAYDVLLTAGFNKSTSADGFNLIDLDSEQVKQQLGSAQHIWLLAQADDSTINLNSKKPLYQWLVKSYQDKVIVVNSIVELTELWRTEPTHQGNDWQEQVDPITYPAPLSLTIMGDGLTTEQWQHLINFKQQKNPQKSADLLPSSLPGNLLGNLPANVSPKPLKFNFFASKKRLGLIDLQWQRELILGQALTVTGRLQQAKENNKQFQLSLMSNNHVVDQVNITGNQAFSLTTTSKVTGLFTYQLLLEPLIEGPAKHVNIAQREVNTNKTNSAATNQGINKTISEYLAVSVISAQKPKVLMKQSAPSFETRRLKQWLKQADSQVHIISQISQSKWAQQKINYFTDDINHQGAQSPITTTLPSHLLTASLLDENDLLIIDSRMLLALEVAEVEALYQAIKNGLGLLINADATLLTSDKPRLDKLSQLLSLFVITAGNESQSQVTAHWPAKPNLAVSQRILSPSPTIAISPKPGQSLVESNSGQILVAQQPLGLGMVAISSLNQTYQWPLQATPALYSHYWQYLFSKIARSESHTRWLAPKPTTLEQVNLEHNICLLSPLPEVYSPGLNLASEPLSKIKKCALFNADSKGWFEFKVFNAAQALLATQARYFYHEADFLAWQQANKHQISQQYAQPFSQTDFAVNPVMSYQVANKHYFWLLMFISMSLLWIERKWQSG